VIIILKIVNLLKNEFFDNKKILKIQHRF